jgi:hypothetical protein
VWGLGFVFSDNRVLYCDFSNGGGLIITIINYVYNGPPHALESVVELNFRKWVENNGGLCLKLGGVIGIPDRIVLWPGGRVEFAEIKKWNGRPKPIQVFWGKKLREMGFTWKIIKPENTKK